ncbi:hypothetical protein E2C01_004627 [Portunus trituberculatus]|uniref:Uncharacterized protein n=1 Tax=Portunus trituberculatus TaxID=210409 RepID=A0A5B7CR74_PORTR|nr:hypothetical protein [Portunus trituberculatus]
MRILPLVLLVCLLGVAAGVNFNIFRWPSFNRKGRGQSGVGYGGGGSGHRGGGGGYGGGGGGGKRKGNPLRSLQRLKTKAITGLRNLKAPIIDGIRNLKSQVFELKGNFFRQAKNLFNKGKSSQGQSSYYRQGSASAPASGYGAPPAATGFTGFSSLRPPSSSYSAPSSPAAGTSSYSSTGSRTKGATGVRQAASSGFRATAASTANNFASAPATGYRAPTGTNSGVRPSQTSSYSHTGTRATGSGDGSYNTQINAPLSAAMAMGHLLNEDEVVKGQPDTGVWRPVLGTSGAAPPIDVRTPVSVASTTKGQSSIGQTSGSTEEPLFIDLGGLGDTTGGSTGVQVTDPAVVVDDDTYIVSATKEYDDVVLVDKGNPDDAAKALSKVVDAALLIDEKPDDHTLLVNDEANTIDSPLLIEDEARKRSLSGGRLQEHPSSVGRADNALSSGRRSGRLQSGQESNMMFSGLMEELRLNTLMALIRRANLEAMLTTEVTVATSRRRCDGGLQVSVAWNVTYENESQQPVSVRKLMGKFALQ